MYNTKYSGVTMVPEALQRFEFWVPRDARAARAMVQTASSVARGVAERASSAGASVRSPRKSLIKFGGLEAILAIRNIKIDMKLKIAKSNKVMNKCHNE